MHELHSILDAWRDPDAMATCSVLATVVHVEGSAYRRPGARMLITSSGRRVGTVSGGCLEGEIAKRAWWFTESGVPVVRVYDTTSDDDAVWEFGLGCNGVVHVLLERVDKPDAIEMLEFLEAQRKAKRPCVVATVVRCNDSCEAHVGDRLLLNDGFHSTGLLAGASIESDLLAHAVAAFDEKQSRLVHLAAADVFVEWIGPPLSLVVFGAGHDAIPLVTIAAELGWSITVADGRVGYARKERFPGAESIIVLPSHDPLRDIRIDVDSAIIVMTHSFPLDLRLVPQILAKEPRYLGLLGPKTRAQRLFQQLGLTMSPNVYAPAGLDIGCDTPSAIALSIVAEIQSVIHQRQGNMLRTREGSIHLPIPEVGPNNFLTSDSSRPSYCETSLAGNV